MELVLSPKAVEDFEEIGDYIARDNPERALSLSRVTLSALNGSFTVHRSFLTYSGTH